MSDDLITAKRVEKFLTSKGASSICPMCRHEKWGLFSFPLGSRTVQLLSTPEEAYVMTCMNCGFVRWHVASVLEHSEPSESPSEVKT